MRRDPLSEESLSKIFKTSPQDPDRLIKREDKNHEFKESYSAGNMATYLKTMAAFANNDGGYIVFGIKDSPRILQGLNDKALQHFNELPVERLTQLLNEYFSPSIEWVTCVYQFRGKSYGIIYVYELKNKPTICKKTRDVQNSKYALKEADIYYRHSGKSERIRYSELNQIIEEKRKNEEKQWLQFLLKAAKVGVDNASILDLNTGTIQEGGGTIIIDENILQRLRFIKEGQFVERDGAPTLRLMGDVQTIESGKVVVGPERKVVRAIEQTDIVECFLRGEKVDNPIDYIKRICSSSTGRLPVFYYIQLAGITLVEAIKAVQATTARGQAKKTLLKRLQSAETTEQKQYPARETELSAKRKQYAEQWVTEKLTEEQEKDLKQCLISLQYINAGELVKHQKYIKEMLLDLYKSSYESADSTLAQAFRDAICRLDIVLCRTEESVEEDQHA